MPRVALRRPHVAWRDARRRLRIAWLGALQRPRVAWLVALLVAAVPGCESADRYMRNRLLDVTDVVDFRYGRAMGLGVKLEASLYLGTGLGLGLIQSSREWYGRHATDFRWEGSDSLAGAGIFAHFGIVGTDGGSAGDAAQSSVNAVLFNVVLLWGSDTPPMIDRWRFGGEVLLPGVHGGMFLNLGELYDFFAGAIGFDPAEDDGLPKR